MLEQDAPARERLRFTHMTFTREWVKVPVTRIVLVTDVLYRAKISLFPVT